jgi:hypothetical protein
MDYMDYYFDYCGRERMQMRMQRRSRPLFLFFFSFSLFSIQWLSGSYLAVIQRFTSTVIYNGLYRARCIAIYLSHLYTLYPTLLYFS